MTVNARPTGRASSIPAGLAWGGFAALTVTLLGTFLTAKMIDTGAVQWNQSGYCVMVIVLAAAWTGAFTATGKVKRRRLLMALGAGMVYMASLLIMTALFFGGQYSGVGETGLLIFCGSLLGIITPMGKKTGKNRRKMPLRNR